MPLSSTSTPFPYTTLFRSVSFDVNPSSRQILADLTKAGAVLDLVNAGARIHQAGCLGCIGIGQAPAVGRNRSEEHTSELQSRGHLVCRLLLGNKIQICTAA